MTNSNTYIGKKWVYVVALVSFQSVFLQSVCDGQFHWAKNYQLEAQRLGGTFGLGNERNPVQKPTEVQAKPPLNLAPGGKGIQTNTNGITNVPFRKVLKCAVISATVKRCMWAIVPMVSSKGITMERKWLAPPRGFFIPYQQGKH
jgi:hypothetical protein